MATLDSHLLSQKRTPVKGKPEEGIQALFSAKIADASSTSSSSQQDSNVIDVAGTGRVIDGGVYASDKKRKGGKQSKLDYFIDERSKRTKETTPVAAPPVSVKEAAAIAEKFEPLSDKDEQLLKSFDYNPQYGPHGSHSRKERWMRASRFQKNPPADVLALLERLPENHPEQQSCSIERVWSKNDKIEN